MKSRLFSRKALPLALLPLLGVVVVVVLLPGDTPLPQHTAAPQPAHTPDRLTLDDGELLEGEVLGQGADHVTLRLPDGTVRLVARERVRDLQRGRARAGDPVRVRLRSGRTVEGELVGRNAQGIELRLSPSGTLVSLRREDVKQVEQLK